jgi:hypothetical protein
MIKSVLAYKSGSSVCIAQHAHRGDAWTWWTRKAERRWAGGECRLGPGFASLLFLFHPDVYMPSLGPCTAYLWGYLESRLRYDSAIN